ncbi:MAG: hypothetical protein K4571_15630 [Deltaproteobacteria bacterium]
MKKMTMILVTVIMVAGLAASALANPGWSDGPRYDNRDRYERPHDRYNDRDDRFHQDERWRHRQPVVIHRAPDHFRRPVVYIARPHVPVFSIFFPPVSIQLR